MYTLTFYTRVVTLFRHTFINNIDIRIHWYIEHTSIKGSIYMQRAYTYTLSAINATSRRVRHRDMQYTLIEYTLIHMLVTAYTSDTFQSIQVHFPIVTQQNHWKIISIQTIFDWFCDFWLPLFLDSIHYISIIILRIVLYINIRFFTIFFTIFIPGDGY